MSIIIEMSNTHSHSKRQNMQGALELWAFIECTDLSTQMWTTHMDKKSTLGWKGLYPNPKTRPDFKISTVFLLLQ